MNNNSPTASLYAELPYPADGVVRTINARILRQGIEKHAPRLLMRDRLRIVDVGCGTGENTTGLRKVFPTAEIVGVDINRKSLDLAAALAERSAANVRFVECDITANIVESLEQHAPGRFDIVFSMGVLHHLAEPQQGFCTVRRLIQPDGLFFCFLYSRFGRREDMAIKGLLNDILPRDASYANRAEAIARLHLGNRHSFWSGFKKLRNRLKFGPPLIPWQLIRVALRRNRLNHESDSYSNPCEHLYDCAEIRALLAETGWEFTALAENAGLPTTPEQHTHKRAELQFLKQLPEDFLYDYFAFQYQAQGYSFYAKPNQK